MTTYNPPKKNTAFVFHLSLISQANTKIMQANPTLAAGDFKVAIDDGAPANFATLPVVDADFTKRVKVELSAAEMNGDNITLICSDAAGAEWCDLVINLQTVARQIDDLAYPTVSGRSLDVTATGAAGIDWANVENPTTALNLSGTNIDPDQVVASVTGSVGSVASGGITAASFAAGALDAVWSVATRLLTAGTNIVLAKGTGVTGFNDLSAAQVNTEVDTALADVGVTPTVTGRIDATISSRLATVGYTAPLDAAGVRGAVGLASADLDTQLGDLPTAAENADQVRTELTTELGRIDVAVSTRLSSAGYTAPPTASAIADQVWDEALSGHAISGSAGAGLSAASAAGDPWGTALPGAYGAGTAGKIIGDNINATISSRAATGAAMTLTAGERGAIALAALLYDWDGITGEANYSTLNALRFLRNHWTAILGILNVYKENGTTLAWSATLATSDTAEPVIGSSPQ
jgi:hypothetical protein